MTDDVDRANDEAAAYLAERIRLLSMPPALPFGVCLYCDVDLGERMARFCDPDCAADWQHQQEVRRRTGV